MGRQLFDAGWSFYLRDDQSFSIQPSDLVGDVEGKDLTVARRATYGETAPAQGIITVAALDYACHGGVQIRIGFNDYGRVTAEFERDFLQTRDCPNLTA